MHIFILLIVITISSCAPIKYSHDYFLECEEKYKEFISLSSCALKDIRKDCENKPDCKLKSKRFVKVIERLQIMVNNEEISDNEAMFRYLNLIDIEISKNNDFKYSYYPEYYNDYFSRRMLPIYLRNNFY
tara:strand:- start:526 stop:915 length:390 start_codon:yes stop_codon:yes gene_type:complete